MKDSIPKDLFDILACPLCRADLRYSKDKKQLICVKCSQKYPIKEGIPLLLPPKQAKGNK
ncbi:Trm112 family protein [Candidatus Woesearchaeota archaeon]|nr:Trm112 family protein [Candidatus Woesearchaeota archaeon]